VYIRFEERSMKKWDYAIITNRYIPPFQLKNKIWPPKDALKIVYADGIPISAVVKRRSDASFNGYIALKDNKLDDAISFFGEAVRRDSTDDMIFYNFAVALFRKGLTAKADSLFRICTKLNPDSDPAYMFLGDMASAEGRTDDAKRFYEKVISVNRKYPEAYISLAKIVALSDLMKGREILRSCIEINPRSAQAINSLGDTYRESDPVIAEKYYKLAQTIK
jgi:tetratricopeptide (TPR) repeat protein